MPSPIKVLFIAGWGRSGSTVLSNLLGQIEGVTSLGEINAIWKKGLLQNRPCACSLPFRSCPFWSRAARSFIEMPREELQRISLLQHKLRLRYGWHFLSEAGREGLREELSVYNQFLGLLFKGIDEANQNRIVVDSSKYSTHGFCLDSIEDIDLYVLHLIRDPRAVVFSWSRKTLYDIDENNKPHYMGPRSTVNSCTHWVAWNLLPEYLWKHRPGRYLRVRYEDFALQPMETVMSIARLLGLEDAALRSFGDHDHVNQTVSHIVAGNPSRFRLGDIRITPDEKWRKGMSRSTRLLTTSLTFPLMARYGYMR